MYAYELNKFLYTFSANCFFFLLYFTSCINLIGINHVAFVPTSLFCIIHFGGVQINVATVTDLLWDCVLVADVAGLSLCVRWAHGSIRHLVCSSSLVLQVRWDGCRVMVDFSSRRNLHSRDHELNRVSLSHPMFQFSCRISQCYSHEQILPRQVFSDVRYLTCTRPQDLHVVLCFYAYVIP